MPPIVIYFLSFTTSTSLPSMSCVSLCASHLSVSIIVLVLSMSVSSVSKFECCVSLCLSLCVTSLGAISDLILDRFHWVSTLTVEKELSV